MNDGHNAAGFKSEGAFTPDKLHARETIERKRVISGGQGVLVRGTVLGRVTATGEMLKSLAAAEDGSQVPSEVLAEDVDTSEGDAEAITYIRGRFATAGITLGTGHTVSSVEAALRDVSIYLESTVG